MVSCVPVQSGSLCTESLNRVTFQEQESWEGRLSSQRSGVFGALSWAFPLPNCSRDFCVILLALPEMSDCSLVWSPFLGVLVVSLLYPVASLRLSEGEK